MNNMIIIKDTPDTITLKNPHNGEVIGTYNGKQIDDYSFVSFQQAGPYWAWTLFEIDAPIIDGVSSPSSGKSSAVNPSGFIYKDEIVKIEVSPI